MGLSAYPILFGLIYIYSYIICLFNITHIYLYNYIILLFNIAHTYIYIFYQIILHYIIIYNGVYSRQTSYFNQNILGILFGFAMASRIGWGAPEIRCFTVVPMNFALFGLS
jgi:hypothetical protein